MNILVKNAYAYCKLFAVNLFHFLVKIFPNIITCLLEINE